MVHHTNRDDFITVVISANQTQTSAIDFGHKEVIALQMPSTWTTANITLLGATTVSGAYTPVYDQSGSEINLAVANNRMIMVDGSSQIFNTIRYMKIRSGTSATPVSQDADRLLEFILRGNY